MKNIWKILTLALLLLSLVACSAQTGEATPSGDASAPADAPLDPGTESTAPGPMEEAPSEATTSATTTTTTTSVATTTTTAAPVCTHDFSKANCQKPATCQLCGETKGEKGAHTYSSGVCTVCGASDPTRADIAKALKAIERYPRYIAINKDLLETQYDLFNMTGEMKHFNDAHETTLEIHDYLQKMIDKCEDYVENDRMLAMLVEDCRECNLEMPTVPGSTSASALRSYISKCKTYAKKADRISVLYNTLCDSYDVE